MGSFLGGQPHPIPQGGVALAYPNFVGSTLLMRLYPGPPNSACAVGVFRSAKLLHLHKCVARFVSDS